MTLVIRRRYRWSRSTRRWRRRRRREGIPLPSARRLSGCEVP